ncbi:hypothetical protein DSO57_1021603 [Entomophthora muscae]|uniref:Uncharacterized protein n=1 Tax=Entomophthora muscae TaxID=34485 RepID=A0ACC2UP74_9FUNG|nr:hypothetical protein DSO57_1021603 [Entomophthora muscae]
MQQKDTKRPSKAPKTPKKMPSSSKKATPKPSPEPSPKKSLTHSTGGEETDGSLTYHSFYKFASDSNCGKFDSLVINSLVLDTLSSTRELSAAYVNLLVFLA